MESRFDRKRPFFVPGGRPRESAIGRWSAASNGLTCSSWSRRA